MTLSSQTELTYPAFVDTSQLVTGLLRQRSAPSILSAPDSAVLTAAPSCLMTDAFLSRGWRALSTSSLPITQWLRAARNGDPDAQNALWNHYFGQVVRLARGRMFALQGIVYDEEDAAVSAMHSVFRGLQTGRFPDLHDRHNLWRLLVTITRRKVRAQWRRESAAKRDAKPDNSDASIEQIICDNPTPEFVNEVMDETERLLSLLDDDLLRRIALLRLDGFTYDEIAQQLDCATRTVSRKIDRIRDIWGVSDNE